MFLVLKVQRTNDRIDVDQH